MSKGPRFREEDKEHIRKMAKEGKSVQDIATELGRSRTGIARILRIQK